MNISTKAALYSGFIFPGAGYFILNKKRLGTISLLLCVSAFTLITVEIYSKAQIIANKIASGTMPLDLASLQEQILSTPGMLDPSIFAGITSFVGILWIVSIIDCYRIGRNIQTSNSIP